MNLLLERFIGVSENEYLITVNKQREPTAWAGASDAAGIELDRPESRQIDNSRATGLVRTLRRPKRTAKRVRRRPTTTTLPVIRYYLSFAKRQGKGKKNKIKAQSTTARHARTNKCDDS